MMIQLTSTYYSASGPSLNDCCFIGVRSEAGRPFSAAASDSWLMRNRPETLDSTATESIYGRDAWMTGLWRSMTGQVFISCKNGVMYLHRAADKIDPADIQRYPLGVPLSGVWGLDDEYVFTWGQDGSEGVVSLWDGKAWNKLPAPGGPIRAMHGQTRDNVYAVGDKGYSARWTGSAWERMSIAPNEAFTSVFVATPENVYVTSLGAALFVGPKPWKKIPGPGPLHAVAHFAGELWVGAGKQGLLRRKDHTNVLECVAPNIEARWFDARKELVITCPNRIVGTPNGGKFTSVAHNALAEQRRDDPPLWLEP